MPIPASDTYNFVEPVFEAEVASATESDSLNSPLRGADDAERWGSDIAYDQIPSREVIDRTMDAVQRRGVDVEFVETKSDALRRLVDLIPAGAEVMRGGSNTLEEIGFGAFLRDGRKELRDLKKAIQAQDDREKRAELRRKSVTADYFLGSVHAVAETGEILTASASGSQLPAYAYSAKHIIWVVGAQKIVPDVDTAFKRIRDYALKLEDEKMKKLGYPGSTIGKILLFERETNPARQVRLILVNERLGF